FADIETASADGTHNPTAKRNVYDANFDLLPVRVGRDNFAPHLVDRPENFHEMIACAEALSAPFEFCRVDLFNIAGEVKFGEITFYPGAGMQRVTPESWDRLMGSWIDLERF